MAIVLWIPLLLKITRGPSIFCCRRSGSRLSESRFLTFFWCGSGQIRIFSLFKVFKGLTCPFHFQRTTRNIVDMPIATLQLPFTDAIMTDSSMILSNSRSISCVRVSSYGFVNLWLESVFARQDWGFIPIGITLSASTDRPLLARTSRSKLYSSIFPINLGAGGNRGCSVFVVHLYLELPKLPYFNLRHVTAYHSASSHFLYKSRFCSSAAGKKLKGLYSSIERVPSPYTCTRNWVFSGDLLLGSVWSYSSGVVIIYIKPLWFPSYRLLWLVKVSAFWVLPCVIRKLLFIFMTLSVFVAMNEADDDGDQNFSVRH